MGRAVDDMDNGRWTTWTMDDGRHGQWTMDDMDNGRWTMDDMDYMDKKWTTWTFGLVSKALTNECQRDGRNGQ
jgi:hypothetical protein